MSRGSQKSADHAGCSQDLAGTALLAKDKVPWFYGAARVFHAGHKGHRVGPAMGTGPSAMLIAQLISPHASLADGGQKQPFPLLRVIASFQLPSG